MCCRLLRRLGDVLMGIRDPNRRRQNHYYDCRKRGLTHIVYGEEKEDEGSAVSVAGRSGLGEWNVAENIRVFHHYEQLLTHDRTQPYLSTSYSEIDHDDHPAPRGDSEDGGGGGGGGGGGLCKGYVQALCLVRRIERERLLPLWWYPNNCLSLEFGKWFSHSDDENIHRDMQHRTLSQYGGMLRLLIAMTSEDHDEQREEHGGGGTGLLFCC